MYFGWLTSMKMCLIKWFKEWLNLYYVFIVKINIIVVYNCINIVRFIILVLAGVLPTYFLRDYHPNVVIHNSDNETVKYVFGDKFW